jgi:hypothetical protein
MYLTVSMIHHKQLFRIQTLICFDLSDADRVAAE